MATKRSKKRRKSGRTSFPPERSPSGAPSRDSEPESSDGKALKKTSVHGSFFDVPPEDKGDAKAASASEDDSQREPAKDPEGEPRDLEQGDPGTKPEQDETSRAEPNASPEQAAEAKDEREDDPDQDDGESDSGNDAAHDDGLHDEFFRKGEEVEKEHIAARAEAVNEPKLEDTGQIRLAALRSAPELIARRKKLRKLVAYVLAPAVAIAAIAGFKAYNGGDHASARSEAPVAQVIVKPSAAPLPMASAVTAAASSAPLASTDPAPDEADTVSDAAVEAQQDTVAEAGVEGDTGAKAEVAAETEAVSDVPENVDARKEALVALNRAKWDQAEKMARVAISRSPDDATLYLYQGTALQEMGRRADAKAVFKRCVENAKRGPINECRMFAH